MFTGKERKWCIIVIFLSLIRTYFYFLDVYFSVLGSLLECEGYYLEDNPCLVCNNPEVSLTVCTPTLHTFF